MTSHKALPEGKVISESVGHSVVSDSSTPWPVACQNLLSMRILQARIVSCPAPGDLLNQGIESRSPALQADSLPLSRQGSPSPRLFLFAGGLGSFFSPCLIEGEILVPPPGMEPTSPAVESWSLNHWTTCSLFFIHLVMRLGTGCPQINIC